MDGVPPDPLESGIDAFGVRLRRRGVSAEAACADYLARIRALDPHLCAYEHVAGEVALHQARAVDHLLSMGVDLGPLMGVPVAVKDIIAVDSMPVTAGSRIAVGDLIGAEGDLVRALRRCGCVFLGKTRTVEFALGATGINAIAGTPWNPWRADEHLIPGGSSSGSAVAVAAGLCGFALGTDTGGSIRNPAALCGVFGLKPTAGLWPTDGCFPLSATFDAIGPLTRSAADAAVVFAALAGRPVPAAIPPRELRLARLTGYFLDEIDPVVARCADAAIDALADAGAHVVELEVPQAAESSAIGIIILRELVTTLGRDRFRSALPMMDPEGAARAAPGLDISAEAFSRALDRHRAACRTAEERMRELDAWVAPTSGTLPVRVTGLADLHQARSLDARIPRNTRTVNWFGQCATSSPVQALGAALPVGLQIACRGGADAKALSIARTLESTIGPPLRPDLTPFVSACR